MQHSPTQNELANRKGSTVLETLAINVRARNLRFWPNCHAMQLCLFLFSVPYEPVTLLLNRKTVTPRQNKGVKCGFCITRKN